ncbi:MAG: DUF4954 family protein, partial [Phycisphaerae bacterium]
MDDVTIISHSDLTRPPVECEIATLARRDALAPGLASRCRELRGEEIDTLTAAGNRCADWSRVRVCDPFDASLVGRCTFVGDVRIGSLEAAGLVHDGVSVETGLVDSTLAFCDLGDQCSLLRVSVANASLGSRLILRDLTQLDTALPATFGSGEAAAISVINEAGGRAVVPFAGMLPADACLQATCRHDEPLQQKLRTLAAEADAGLPPVSRVDDGCVVLGAGRLRNVRLGEGCVVRGAAAVQDVTARTAPDARVMLGERVTLESAVLHPGVRVQDGCTARRVVLGESVTLKLGARVVDSIVGDNSTISCCEVLCSLLLGSHEQHHNNSFLIAVKIDGQSNVAAGATIGSNHNSRAADGEIHAGRGFWPGLCTSLKHNSRFASYTLIAKGSYPAELNVPLPFSLVSNDPANGHLVIMPAFWWLHNMYALARNREKLRRRDRRVVAAQAVEFDPLAPDTAEEMLHAMDLLAEWAGKAYLGRSGKPCSDVDRQEILKVGRQMFLDIDTDVSAAEVIGEQVENSRRPVMIVKPHRGWHAYRQMLHYYAAGELLRHVEANPERPMQEMFASLEGPRVSRWTNLGGQLLPAEQVDA